MSKSNFTITTLDISGEAPYIFSAGTIRQMSHGRCVCHAELDTVCCLADNPCDNTYFDWSLDFETYIDRNRCGLTNADIFVTPVPSSLKAPSPALGRSPLLSPVASLGSWAQASTPTSPMSPTSSTSTASETVPSPFQAEFPSSTRSFSTSPARSLSPLAYRAALQPIDNFQNALIPYQHAKADSRPAGEAEEAGPAAIQLHRRYYSPHSLD